MEHISEELLYHIAELSKVNIPKEDMDKTRKSLYEMMLCVDKMNELNTDDISLSDADMAGANVFREDVVVEKDGQTDALSGAPKCIDGMFVVPRTLG